MTTIYSVNRCTPDQHPREGEPMAYFHEREKAAEYCSSITKKQRKLRGLGVAFEVDYHFTINPVFVR